VGHGFETYYRASAEAMIASMVDVITAETGTYDRSEWQAQVDGRQIAITPDRVIITADGVVRVQRMRTGRKTKSEPGKPIYALLRRAARAQYPNRTISIETFYVATRETVPVMPQKDDELLAEYRDAITKIESERLRPHPRTLAAALAASAISSAITFTAFPDLPLPDFPLCHRLLLMALN
jgi:DNA helicase-2/ATP-dependent DNA helicase PcrA